MYVLASDAERLGLLVTLRLGVSIPCRRVLGEGVPSK